VKTYLVTVDETLVQTAVYTVLARSVKEAKEKALAGDTEAEDIDPYSTEVSSREIRDIEEDTL
jgi:hypothetical protein